MKLDGTFCMVGLPNGKLSFSAFSMFGNRLKLTSSAIGSVAEIKDMLEFAAKHNVRPIIQRYPLAKVNDAIKTVRDGTVRLRCVLEN
jgi:D-arabinose 1-dehydrogenase-like Zn-dependent alcohol dehydrogenase